MANETDICNIALSRVGASPIDSLDDKSKSGNSCRALYPTIRNAVLRDYDWAFARAEASPMLKADTFNGYLFSYEYPANCVNVLRIVPPGTPVDISYCSRPLDREIKKNFDIRISSDLNNKLIVTNIENAIIIYTARVLNPTVFDDSFVNALSWCLASELAIPILGSFQLQQSLYNVYIKTLGRAAAHSLNESDEQPTNSNELTNARL